MHKDLFLDLFSASAVQMESHSGQIEPIYYLNYYYYIYCLDTAEFIDGA